MELMLMFAGILFLLGLVGLLVRRNILFMLMSIEIMLNSAGLVFIIAGTHWGEPDGQVMFIFILAVAAVEGPQVIRAVRAAALGQRPQRRRRLVQQAVDQQPGRRLGIAAGVAQRLGPHRLEPRPQPRHRRACAPPGAVAAEILDRLLDHARRLGGRGVAPGATLDRDRFEIGEVIDERAV